MAPADILQHLRLAVANEVGFEGGEEEGGVVRTSGTLYTTSTLSLHYLYRGTSLIRILEDMRGGGGRGLEANNHPTGVPRLEETSPLRNLLQAYAQGPMVVLGGGPFSYERGTPVFA